MKTCSLSKLCTSAAAVASVDSSGNGFQVTCCNSYLCNYSGAASVTLHRWLLVLPLLLIILLFTQHTWDFHHSGYRWIKSHHWLKLSSYWKYNLVTTELYRKLNSSCFIDNSLFVENKDVQFINLSCIPDIWSYSSNCLYENLKILKQARVAQNHGLCILENVNNQMLTTFAHEFRP